MMRIVLLLLWVMNLPIHVLDGKTPFGSILRGAIPVSSVPYQAVSVSKGYDVLGDFENYFQLYRDIQGTDSYYDNANSESGFQVLKIISIPESSNKLIHMEHMAEGDCLTTGMLFLVDQSGNILDFLEVGRHSGPIHTRQFRLNRQCEVIVFDLVCATPTSIPFFSLEKGEIQSFTASRHDTKYVIRNNQFCEEEEMVYEPETYHRLLFLSGLYIIEAGTEQPINNQ